MHCPPTRHPRLLAAAAVLASALGALPCGPLAGSAAHPSAPVTGSSGATPVPTSATVVGGPVEAQSEPARPSTPPAPALAASISPVGTASPTPPAVPGPVATAAPAVAPTAAPTARATPRPTAPPTIAAAPPLPGPPYTNRLISSDGVLNTGVGLYTDCSGRATVPSAVAAIDTCYTDRIYFVGHTPGVFGHLARMPVGSTITYWDGGAAAHLLRIIDRRLWPLASGATPAVAGATVQFQTCETPDGSIDLILSAAPA